MRPVVCAWVVLVALAGVAEAAPKTFDVMTYQVPKGWHVEPATGVLSVRRVDEKQGTFALIIVQPSMASAGSLDKDFRAAWDAQIVPGFKVTTAPQMTAAESENGWDAKSGTAAGETNGFPAGVILVTATGHGRTMHMIIVTNTESFASGIDEFLTSVKLGKPKASAPVEAAPSSATATTTFPDGWTAKVEADWVSVTRGSTRVYLHYPITLDDELRLDVIEKIWRRLVTPRYTLKNVSATPHSAMDFPYYFRQADATENGKAGFVSFRVVTANGIAYPIEVFAPSKDAFLKDFPDQDQLAAIANANRFAIGKDVAGTWDSSTSAGVAMYYVSSGGFAGMDTAVGYDKFVFNANGSYSSEHKGATSTGGSMKAYQQRYKGTYSVAPWELTLKNQSGTTVYTAHFEAVRGGRILRLQNKKYSGLTYALVRAR